MRTRSPDFQLTIMERKSLACRAVSIDRLCRGKQDQLIRERRAKHHQEKSCDYRQDKIWWPPFHRRENIFVLQRVLLTSRP
jgi:hypothetical protein